MKIGITGGTGFLGQYVVQEIKKNGRMPYILTRSKQENSEFILSTDYTTKDLTTKLRGLDAVVHLAAERTPKGRISDYHSSEIITQNIYEACKINDISNVVFASTISVYGNKDEMPWNEKQFPNAKTMYGISKLSSELIGNKYSIVDGLKIKNLRFAHLFGFNEQNNYMINLFMRKAYHKKTIVLNTSSSSRREFLYAKDAAKAVIKALDYEEYGTFNIGNEKSILTNENVAVSINKVFDNENNLIIKNPDSPDDSESSFMDSSYSRKVLNFSPDYTFEKALQEIHINMEELESVPETY